MGFKSFKDRTVIHFDSGITGVVGPNGCGKSNIVDALIWVMGEMSARHLRGSSMEDVIFSGADGYTSMGLCEVSLVLENEGGLFPAKYLNHPELMVTRRLHRSGESEYLINRQPARLRDIQEIFMDTGVGARGFSIVEQGAISQMITAKPEERRVLIEEAAGITKFRNRKRESQRKLKATEANLLRLQDIIRELKRQMDSLQRQAQRAERYRKLKTEMEAIELWISSKEFLELQGQTHTAQKEFNQAQDRQMELETKVAALEAELAELRGRALSEEKVIENFRISLGESQEEVRKRETEIQEMGFQVEQARRSKEMASSRFTENQIREKTFVEDFNILAKDLTQIGQRAEELKSQYETEKNQYDQKRNLIEEYESRLSEKRKELFSLTETEAGDLTRQGRMEETASHVEVEVDQAKNTLDELENRKTEFDKNYKKALEGFQKERQMQMDIFNDVESLKNQKEKLDAELEVKESEVLLFKEKLNEVTSRLYGLENLRDNFEGFEEGVKSIMLRQREGLGVLDKEQKRSCEKFTPVSEILRVPEALEVALEAVLGPRLQMLVSQDREESLKALEYLKEKKSGRSSFYSASGVLQTHDTSESSLVKSSEGVKALLGEVVQMSEKQRPIMERLIHKVAVVEDIHQAIKLQLCFPSWTFVTLEGDLFTCEGIISGGHKGDVSTGVLQREREIDQLKESKEEWAGKLALARAAMKKIKALVDQVSEYLKKAHRDETNKEILITGLKKDLQRVELEQQNVNQALGEQEQKLDDLLKREKQIREELSALSFHLHKKAEKKKNLELFMAELTISLETEKSGLNDLQNKVTHLRVENAKKQQEFIGVQKEHQRLKKSLAEIREQMNRMNEESSKNSQLMTDTRILLEEKKAKLEVLIQKVEEQKSGLAALRDDFEKSNARLFEVQEIFSRTAVERNKQQSRMNEARLLFEQSRMNERNLVESIRERYQKDLSQVAEELAVQDRDRESSEEEMNVLKEELARIGQVNLSAIEEYDELATRFDFLSQQNEDLVGAKSQLDKVIERINRICSKRFRETFEAVNSQFEKVFPMLFGGGEARLVLVEDPEKEETGIDIVSKPPGKKLQNVSLLSGGEKALTAVSLIFSIFLVKPSPYCLLDEVDAPLDDANVMRFNDLVREMAKRSQVILVTHNKYTMEVAEKLYGVTMEERGVSKMVSVDLSAS